MRHINEIFKKHSTVLTMDSQVYAKLKDVVFDDTPLIDEICSNTWKLWLRNIVGCVQITHDVYMPCSTCRLLFLTLYDIIGIENRRDIEITLLIYRFNVLWKHDSPCTSQLIILRREITIYISHRETWF